MTPRFKKVTIGGVELWAPVDMERESFALPQKHHITPDGEGLSDRCFDGDSFAHVFGSEVVQYNKVIGTRADIVDGWASDAAVPGGA